MVRILIFGLGIFMTMISLVKDTKYELNSFQASLTPKKNHLQTINRFAQLIHFHSDVKQLSDYHKHFIDVFSERSK